MRKKVLITGGARGLGKAIAIEFAHHDYDIIFTYLNSKAEAEKLKHYLENEYQVDVETFKLDLTDEVECKNIKDKISNLDVLINNAAFNEDKNFDEFTTQDFIRTYKTNAIGPYLLSTSLRPLLESSHGNIVNIASTNGMDTMYKESIPYDASKSALINITKNLSTALAPNIRVNAVAPGWIATEGTEDMETNFKKAMESSNLFHRFASPEEIARAVYFVGSEDSSFMTGSIIRIDGGNNYGNR